jgi:bifunctional DNA-binding transcriptional regulator/antitoxin component of YhaV-PrlF toxin-antitoxin module
MIRTDGQFEPFKGSAPAISPTATPQGIFSLCSGGVPTQGAFGRLPGKTLRDAGLTTGGAITIYQMGDKVVIQRVAGMEIHNLADLSPNEQDYVVDNFGNLVYDNHGILVTQ